jgi:hypothetical protein
VTEYYIQNRLPVGNCISWWREGGCGYTCDIDQAGKFSEKEALSIVRSRPDVDKAWPVSVIEPLINRHVDHQSLGGLKPL